MEHDLLPHPSTPRLLDFRLSSWFRPSKQAVSELRFEALKVGVKRFQGFLFFIYSFLLFSPFQWVSAPPLGKARVFPRSNAFQHCLWVRHGLVPFFLWRHSPHSQGDFVIRKMDNGSLELEQKRWTGLRSWCPFLPSAKRNE